MKSKIPSVIRDVLEFNLDVAQHDRRAARHLSIPSTPLTFQDKHLDANYILKRVVFLPNLLTELSTFVDGLLESVEEFPDKDLPSSESPDDEINPISGFTSIAFDPSADQVAAHYHESIATQCCSLASFLVLHSKYPGWTSYLSWKQPWKQSTPEWEEWLITHKPRSLILNKTSPRSGKIQDSLTPEEQRIWNLLSSGSKYEPLAVWQIFACIDASRKLFQDIQDIARRDGNGNMAWKRPCTKGYHHEPSHCSYDRYPDASGTPWILPPDLSAPVEESTSSPQSRTTLIEPPVGNQKRYRKKKELPVVLAEDYLQNAWAHAVHTDATFIIFHRGANEIICIRHRASQTLYVSEIIDTCTNYGKLQTALYAAILKDKADRQEIWEKKHPPRPEQKEETKKRPLESQKDSSRKRSRSNSDCGAHPFKGDLTLPAYNMKERCKNLDVVAVTLDYYLHRSTVPSFFVRCKQTSEGKIRSLPVRPSYSLDSCLRLDLKQRIGGGAVGTTYRATLTIGSDSTRCEDVVVKLANNDDRSRKHLRHEFSIYEHLARAKVQAVPHLYGLFEDVESENSQLILVTSYAGESLAVIHMSRYGRTSTSGTVLIPKAEQPVFLHQLAEIHEAGIHHRDLRPPNIVVDHDGKITFIDFDKARSYVTGKQRKHERKRLLNLMNGRYVDYDRTSLRSSGAQCSDCSSDDDRTWEALQRDSESEEVSRAKSEPPLTNKKEKINL